MTVELLAKEPERPHCLAAGTSTTFVIKLSNNSDRTISTAGGISIVPANRPDWRAAFFLCDKFFRPIGEGCQSGRLDLTPGVEICFVAEVHAPAGLSDGVRGEALVTVVPDSDEALLLHLRVTIRNRPKVYYVAVDGLCAGYLYLNRRGEAAFSGHRLMPRSWDFLNESAFLQRAFAHVPASTDPNHLSAMSGMWPASLGLYHAGVTGYYMGSDADTGHRVVHLGDKCLLKRGCEGEPIHTIFDYLKTDGSFGSSDTLGLFVSGKEWLSRLHKDGKQTVLTAGAVMRQPYFLPPAPYRLGDPESDSDAEADRDGNNVGPPGEEKTKFDALSTFIMSWPVLAPEDRWVAGSAIQLIYAEDPDVSYILFPQMDTVQHVMGAADRPGEWIDPGTPEILWDDRNVYNAGANRSSILDTVYEADVCFGMILDVLKARGIYDMAYVIFLADHAFVTQITDEPIDITKILLDHGMLAEDIVELVSIGEHALIFSDKAQRIEEILEGYEVRHPVWGRKFRPFLVINREEMDSGHDPLWGDFALDGIPFNKKGELYSEWNIDFPVDDNSKVSWPDLFVFSSGRMSLTTVLDWAFKRGGKAIWRGTHGSPATLWIPLGMRGPGIRPGFYEETARISDIAPTLYRLLGISPIGDLDGRVMEWIIEPGHTGTLE